MSGLYFCLIAFLSCFACSVVSLRNGLIILLGWGYFFGLLKANYIESNGLFIFDAATIGFYLGLILNPGLKGQSPRFSFIIPWVAILIGWPVFMATVPIQHYLVQVIGLRGNIFWIPMILVGLLLRSSDKRVVVEALALFNIVALGFAIAEFIIGVEYFIPENHVTRIIYDSSDLKDGARRIPSIFANAHSYANFMVATIPWIIGEIVTSKKEYILGPFSFLLLLAGLICALMGIFMAGPRQPIVVLGMFFVLVLFSRGYNFGFLVIVGFVSVIVGYFVVQDERMQRFTTLQDIGAFQERLEMSLNMTFLEVLMDYPMGNGMGGGGTSLPNFAQALLSRSIVLENEFARILLEQGLPGLLIFLAFFCWFISRIIHTSDPYYLQKIYIRFYSFISIGTAFIGIGLMTTIPGTAFLMLGVGFCISPGSNGAFGPWTSSLLSIHYLDESTRPAYQRGLSRA